MRILTEENNKSIAKNMNFSFENPYSFASDNKLEEITINDLSLLVICSNT